MSGARARIRPGPARAALLALATLPAAVVAAPPGIAPPAVEAVPAGGETLEQAIADAYRHNPQLQAQRAELRALDETVIEALSPYRLAAGFTGAGAYNRRRQRSVSSEGFATFEQRSLDATLTITQLISSGGRVAAQVSAAEADVLAGRERLREVENGTLFEVVDAYASVRRDERLVGFQLRAVESYRRQVAQNRSRAAEGDLALTDVAQAEAQLLIIEAALAQARASLERNRSRFAAVVGRNPGTLAPAPPLAGVPASIELAYAAAERESPAFTQAVLAERASRDRISAARAERHPTIAAQGSFGYTNPLGFQTRDLGQVIGAGVSVTMPILTQGIVDSRVRAALAVQQSAVFRVEDARRTVAAGLLNAWNQVVTAQAQRRSGTAAVAAAEAALGGVRRGFAEGFRSNFEVIDSEQRLLSAQVLVTNADYALYLGQATLLAVLGRLQAAATLDGVAPFDPAANLARQRRRQFGPFVPLVRAFDAFQKPYDHGRPPPVVPPPVAPPVARMAGPAPDGGLATALPLPGGP